MCKLTIIDSCTESLGIHMRKPTPGPEIEIVKRYIDAYCAMAEERSWKRDVIIFVEPRLDSGYPDLLIAHYDPKCVSPWEDARDDLSSNDLKILSCLMNCCCRSSKDVAHVSGFSEEQVEESMRMLESCNMTTKKKFRWHAASRSSFFALKQLIAIEAKTENATEALLQAFRNTRYASKSYSLLGTESINKRTLNRYLDLGVGVIFDGDFEVAVPPREQRIPICHTSLLVNEWISKKVSLGEKC